MQYNARRAASYLTPYLYFYFCFELYQIKANPEPRLIARLLSVPDTQPRLRLQFSSIFSPYRKSNAKSKSKSKLSQDGNKFAPHTFNLSSPKEIRFHPPLPSFSSRFRFQPRSRKTKQKKPKPSRQNISFPKRLLHNTIPALGIPFGGFLSFFLSC